MKITLAHVGSRNPEWLENLAGQYEKKIKHMTPISRVHIRSSDNSRDDKAKKLMAEEKSILKALPEGEHLVIFSEEGKKFESSEQFSKELVQLLARQPGKIYFLIGGPYGIPESIKSRAIANWSLSRLTLNHHLAQLVSLEQIYRGLSIWKNLPYHN
jgi:23S rRNA (pseudouridine1915-N3)-methyltransferase